MKNRPRRPSGTAREAPKSIQNPRKIDLGRLGALRVDPGTLGGTLGTLPARPRGTLRTLLGRPEPLQERPGALRDPPGALPGRSRVNLGVFFCEARARTRFRIDFRTIFRSKIDHLRLSFWRRFSIDFSFVFRYVFHRFVDRLWCRRSHVRFSPNLNFYRCQR